MKKTIIIFVILISVLMTGCNNEPVSTTLGETVFGAFTTTSIDGEPVDYQVFSESKLTMVNIWATFCGPCIEEMPALAQLNNEFGDDFRIIGMVVDVTDMNGNILPNKKAEAEVIIQATGADYLHLLPSKSLNSAYLSNVQAVPETVFVDENGNQVGQRYLGSRSKDEWQKIIEALLESVS